MWKGDKHTDTQTHRHTNYSTNRSNRPSGPIRWKDLAGTKARLTLVKCFPAKRRGWGAPRSERWSFPCLFCVTQVTKVRILFVQLTLTNTSTFVLTNTITFVLTLSLTLILTLTFLTLTHLEWTLFTHVCQVFRDYLFFPKIFATLFTMQWPICLFHMDNHIYQVMYVICVEKFQDETVHQRTFTKNHILFFGLLVEDINISDIFY